MMNKVIQSLRDNLSLVIVVCIVISASIFRIQAYGDVRLSIAGNDTASYIEASQVPLFSSEMMTGRRLLTTNLLYKIFEPQDGYEILVNGSVETTRRVIQPSFNGIVILQLAFSIIGWGMLATVIAHHLQNRLMKILSAIIILFFGFTPHIADWDSILMSESLTFSLFILKFAILLHVGFILYKNPNAKFTGWMIAWMITHFVWTFLRDTNLFASIITIFMILVILYFAKQYRTNLQIRIALFFLIFILAIGLFTATQSTRSTVQLINVYHDDIIPSPLRTEIFKKMGMPEWGTPEFRPWLTENGTTALIKFMLLHPGYPITKIQKDFPLAFVGTKQTYFKAPELTACETLMSIGNALHPQNFTPFFVSLLLLFGIVQVGFQNDSNNRPWTWGALWLFFVASIMFIPSILGDTWALNRHSLLSTQSYKLCMWLFAIIIMDVALSKPSQVNTLTK